MNDLKAQIYYMIAVFIIVLMLLIAKSAYPEDCESVLKDCDTAVTTCHELTKEQRNLVVAQDNLIVKLTKQRNEALELSKPSVAFPWYVGIVLGVAGGVILTRGLR